LGYLCHPLRCTHCKCLDPIYSILLILSVVIRQLIQFVESISSIITRCNTLQHTAARCNTLQHAATRCKTLQHAATRCNMLQHAATRCSTLQHLLISRYISRAMGWLRLGGSLKSYVSFAEYRLFHRALLQKRPIILMSLLLKATPY